MHTAIEFLKSSLYKVIIEIVIAFYALTLTGHAIHFYFSDSTFMAIEKLLVSVLCIDVFLRAVLLPSLSWRSGWFYFDLVTTLLAFVPGFEPCRAIRLYRILARYNYFRDAVEDMGSALKMTLPLMTIFFMSVYIKGLIGYYAFAQTMPEQFGELWRSMIMSTITSLGESLEYWMQMFEIAPGPTIVHIMITVYAGVLIISLIFAKSSDASASLKTYSCFKHKHYRYSHSCYENITSPISSTEAINLVHLVSFQDI